MTFYEAALEALTREGKPLHVSAIVEIAVRENLLSHVGKSPEEVMQSRLLSMARVRGERRIMATAPETYALVEWGMPEDAAALEQPEKAPPTDEQPLRPKERHPKPSPDNVRVAGRGDRARKRREEIEEKRKQKRLAPVPELVLELLSAAAAPMSAADLAAEARSKELGGEELNGAALIEQLREENQRRKARGRSSLFVFGPDGTISLDERARRAPRGEEGESGGLFTLPLVAAAPGAHEERGGGTARIQAQLADHKRQVVRQLRRRMGELDAPSFERAALALLEAMGFREPRLSKRQREGCLLTARRAGECVGEHKYLVRLVRGNSEVDAKEVSALRSEAEEQGVHFAMLVSAGEASREARAQSQAAAFPVVMLLCGDRLGEQLIVKKVGTLLKSVELSEVDEEFFSHCKGRAREQREGRDGKAQQGQQPQRGEREQGGGRNGAETRPGRERDTRPPAAPPLLDPELERRLDEEARLRAMAHDRIEAAEAASRASQPMHAHPHQ